MEINNKPVNNEEIIIKRQWVAFIATFVLFFPAVFISLSVFGIARYSILAVMIPMMYLGTSSIKNRVSIMRLRGQKGYSRDTRALIFGIITVVVALGYFFILFNPLLSERLLPF